MKIIDIHHHWVNEPGYLDSLLREMDRIGVERTGLIAMGPPARRLFLTEPEAAGCAGNRDLAKIIRSRPERFFAYGFFSLGTDPPELVDWFAEQRFLGVKFHLPGWDYDDDRCFSVYERAARLALPCLFHTGIFRLPASLPGKRPSSARCRPVMLDPIAQEFPALKIISAHLGVCWGEEAAALCRIHPNIYADLSGKIDGWISGKGISWFKEILFWPEAHKKILFGSDVHCHELEAALDGQTDILRQLGWSQARIGDFLYQNAANIFGFED